MEAHDQVHAQVTFFMKNFASGSAFADALISTIRSLPVDTQQQLPLGVVLLEADGTLTALNVPINDENIDDVAGSMFAMEYIAYAFERFDWMQEYVRSLEFEKDTYEQTQAEKRRARFTLIQGGKEDGEG